MGEACVWLVEGERGEYDEHETWIVEAHGSQAAAQARADALNALVAEFARARKIAGMVNDHEVPDAWSAAYRERAHDDRFASDASYSAFPVPLK
jgi:hypothetical protein